jgi:hypothetical protein
MSYVLAIDPGTDQSAYVYWSHSSKTILGHDILPNEQLLRMFLNRHWRLWDSWDNHLAIEMIASYGMPVGREVFETCLWIGRFMQASGSPNPGLYYRKDVKLHLCGSPRAKDGKVRQALIDLVGPQGTKKAPGPTYGIKSHTWAALAVAVYAGHVVSQATTDQQSLQAA